MSDNDAPNLLPDDLVPRPVEPVGTSLARTEATMLAALDRFLEVAAVVRKDRLVRPLEAQFAPYIRAAFKQQEEAFMTGFAALEPRWPVRESGRLQEAADLDWESIWLSAVLASLAAFEEPFAEYIALALELGMLEAVATLQVDMAFDLAHPRAVAYMEQVAANRVTMVNEATKARIRQIVTRGADEGKSYGQVAKELREQFRAFRVPKPQKHIRDRAELIAITEIGEGYEAGNYLVGQDLQQYGFEMEKSWLTVGDDRVSDGCAENEGADWIPFGETFPSGDERPLRFPGCRCTLLQRRVGASDA